MTEHLEPTPIDPFKEVLDMETRIRWLMRMDPDLVPALQQVAISCVRAMDTLSVEKERKDG